MSIDYLKNATSSPNQREKLSPNQVMNSAAGFVFAADDWTRLERFLILGSEGGTYYSTERKLTRDNAEVVKRLIGVDGVRLVKVVTEVSESGRAPKNDPAILALAMAAKLGDPGTRSAAYAALPKVCRIGTHLYHFVAFANDLGGWGRGLRRAVGNWFNDKPADAAAFQMTKYQSRDKWSARDLLRLAHPTPVDPSHRALYRWATQGYDSVLPMEEGMYGDLPPIVHAHEEAKTAELPRLLKLIREHGLQRESIPTEMLTKPEVWEALLPKMGLTALIRNLGTMTKIGLIAPLSDVSKDVVRRLGDGEALRKSRVHPMAILMANTTYASGRGVRGTSTWSPVQPIVDALDAAFYTSFKNVTPTGKNTLLAIDVSGSMDGGEVAGMTGITPRIAAAAMALITSAVEPNSHIVGFTCGNVGYGGKWGGAQNALAPIAISSKMRLTDVIRVMKKIPMGGTDCALPFIWAKEQLKKNIKVENFAVYTDNETWAGGVHPKEALDDYRRASGLPARSAVVAFTASPFTIADPNDAGMLDFCGFDSSAPAVMADFFRGDSAETFSADEDVTEAE